MNGPADPQDLGTRLRRAREQRGVSLRQIATSTKISVSMLEALERNDFSRLPGGIFGRAFVRSYAQEVGLDPEETVQAFLASQPAEAGSAAGHAPVHHVDREESLFESQQRMAGVALRLILVSVPIAALILYFTLGHGLRRTSRAPEKAPVSAGEPREVRSTPLQITAGPPPSPAPESGGGASAAPEAPPPASGSQPVEFAESAQEGLVLDIAPTGSCWVSVTVDGVVAISRVMNPGEHLVRHVRQVALVQVGDAGAFAFTLNGRPGRPLGTAGEVKSVQITPDNYRTYLR